MSSPSSPHILLCRLTVLTAAGTLLLAGSAALASTPPAATKPAASSASPQQTAAAFCALYNRRSPDAQYAKVLSPQLLAAVRVAQQRDAAYRTRYPDDKPPLADGLGLSSLQDRGRCQAGQRSNTAGQTLVTVSYSLPDGARFIDQLLLVQQDGAWKIDDVRYPKGHHFPGMRQYLHGVFQE